MAGRFGWTSMIKYVLIGKGYLGWGVNQKDYAKNPSVPVWIQTEPWKAKILFDQFTSDGIQGTVIKGPDAFEGVRVEWRQTGFFKAEFIRTPKGQEVTGFWQVCKKGQDQYLEFISE